MLIGQAVDERAGQETKQAGDQIIQFTFAATSDAGAWSETRQGHANPENQPANNIADHVRGGYGREGDQA